jgi:inorganic triphosphatase YgiF
MSHEVELKLEIAPEDAEGLSEQPWLFNAQPKTQQQRSTYYDTHGRLLRKSGYSLRVRSAGNRFTQTLKSLDGAAGLFTRGEWEYEVDGPEPDVERLADTPAGELQLDGLEAIVRSDVKRTTWCLHQADSEIEIDLDEGVISAGKRRLRVSELELELRDGRADAVFTLAGKIAVERPLRLSVLSKAERGFALAEGRLSKPTKAEAVAVQQGMTVAEGFATIVNACQRHFRLNEPLVIEARAAEALHQARVATRRLRSALSLFGPLIRDRESMRIREELHWFTCELGDARNFDVFLQNPLTSDQRHSLEEKREAAYDGVIAAMNSGRFRHLMLDVARWSAQGDWRKDPKAEQALEPFANRRIDRIWSKVSAARHLRRMDDQHRHRLRIRAKKLRYAVEFMAALHVQERERQKQFGKALEKLQDELGQLHDLVVARSLAGTSAEEWLVLPAHPRREERKHVDTATGALRRMRKVGPYWRS